MPVHPHSIITIITDIDVMLDVCSRLESLVGLGIIKPNKR
jgi:hypothetical protein